MSNIHQTDIKKEREISESKRIPTQTAQIENNTQVQERHLSASNRNSQGKRNGTETRCKSGVCSLV
jgi:hypothetical protein